MSLGGYAKLEYSQRGIKLSQAEKAAAVFGCSIHDLIGEPPFIPLVGAANSGQAFFADGGEYEGMKSLTKLNISPSMAEGMSAVIVAGDWMEPRFPAGSVALFSNNRLAPNADLIGEVIVGETIEGFPILRTLMAGSKRNFWDLHSEKGEVEHDVVLVWAAEVQAVIMPSLAEKLILRETESESDSDD
ncbi:hypothetical protein ATO13_22366 [Stappia sp. 22II-S9-Z10]|nr:hypothetical protein ATO13_22366 [Stappia sp. 22II-S9-Z10]